MLTSLLFCLLPHVPNDPKAPWLELLAERRAEATGKVTFEEILEEAALLGLPEADAPKSALLERMRRVWERTPAGAVLPVPDALAGKAPAYGSVASADEREPNDTRGWADPLVLGTLQRGSVAGSFDSDLFAFDVTEDSWVELVTGPGEAGAIDDTLLELSDERGAIIAFSDDAIGLFAAVRAPLSAGRYYARVRGYGGSAGEYELATSVAPADVADLAPVASLSLATSAASPLVPLRLELPSDGRLTLLMNGIAGFDPILSLRTPQGAEIATNDDSVGLNSQIRIDLTAGTYLLFCFGYDGATGSFTLQSSFAPGSMPQACVGPLVGSYAVMGQFTGFELELTGAPLTELVLTLGPSLPGSADDTILTLFDADWRFLASNDDFTGFFSSLRLALPPGTYHALVQPFPGSSTGNFTVSASCAAAATSTPRACGETGTMTLGPGGWRAYRIEPGNAVFAELRTDNGGFVNDLDSVAALFSLDGELLDWNDDVDLDFNARVGAHLAAEGAWAVVWGFDGVASGSTETHVSCPLAMFGTPSLGATLLQLSLAKSGSYVLTLRALPGSATPLPLIDGLLLLDPGTIRVTLQFYAPSTGSSLDDQVLPSEPSLAGVLLRFQTVVLDPDREHAWTSNAVEAQL